MLMLFGIRFATNNKYPARKEEKLTRDGERLFT